jgi:hypothetical protein
MTAIIKYCEFEHVPYDLSPIYMRNLELFGQAVADFYTYELERELGEP